MHPHRSAGPSPLVARPGDIGFHAQRRLLLELVVDPPADGDAVGELASALELTAAQVQAAAAVLVSAGLAERRGDRVVATAIVLAVEQLWPLAL